MVYKALAVAAAMTIGISQADAAVVKYDIDLRYLGTTFRDVIIYVNNPAQDVFVTETMGLEGNPFGITGMQSGLTYGQTVKFTAEVHFPENQDEWISAYDNGGRAYNCMLGNASCDSITQAYQWEDSIGLFYDDSLDFVGELKVGGKFTNRSWRPWVQDRYEWGSFYAEWETAEFEVLKINQPQPAPVPLPATAALLPLGVGALAVLRKRRKISG